MYRGAYLANIEHCPPPPPPTRDQTIQRALTSVTDSSDRVFARLRGARPICIIMSARRGE